MEAIQGQGKGTMAQTHRHQLDVIDGRRTNYTRKLLEAYAITKDEADQQIKRVTDSNN